MSIICEKYKILECLYQNQSNTIYLTEHVSLNTKRIIKQMKKQNNFQLAEIEILKQLAHPNIPKIIDVLEDEEYIYLIREYARGKNLEEWLVEKESFNNEELQNIGFQLAEVLRYLHESFEIPIIYRDLKPENIIMNDEGNISLIDFGIARKAFPDRTQDTQFLGTKAYAAPEQFGIFRSDEKSDMYAFGMTLYYLLSQHKIDEPPYKRFPIEQWLRDYNEDLIQIIYECCEPEREKRPDSFTEIKKRFERIGFKEQSEIIPENAKIYMGLRHGAGTSFITFAHAFEQSLTGKKIGIIDWSESQQISKLQYVLDETEVRKYSFVVNGIEIFPKNKQFHLLGNWKKFDVLFIDYGILTNEKKKQLAQCKDDVYFVCSGAIWDIVDFDEMMFNQHLIDYQFILNLADKELLNMMRQEYPNTEFNSFSYQNNLYAFAYNKSNINSNIQSNQKLNKELETKEVSNPSLLEKFKKIFLKGNRL